MYCSEDNSVTTVGSYNDNGKMSPKNMLTTTICDELKLATNFKSKVIGISIKDRGAILPAGHSADAAYWYDSKTGKFISSTYYMNELPKWVLDFNGADKITSYYEKNWNTLYPINSYLQSDSDTNQYESTPLGSDQKQFPYDLKRFAEKKDYGKIRSTPYGNSLTMDFAKAALIQEQLGKDSITDFLAVSLSSPDYIGHAFGPNSVEVEDTYLRLDKELAEFLTFLDKQVGKNNYTLFLSADHGVAHIPGYLEKHKLPNGGVTGSATEKKLNAFLKEKFGYDSLCIGSGNYQFYLNHTLIEEKEADYEDVLEATIAYLKKVDGVDKVFEYADMQESCDSIDVQPMDIDTIADSDVFFFIGGAADTAEYQWQTNLGLGWTDLFDAGQYMGVNDDTLYVININELNNNQLFRCLINNLDCKDTSEHAILTVNDQMGIGNIISGVNFILYPNPITENAQLDYTLLEEETLSIYLYNRTGKLITSLIENKIYQAGSYKQKIIIPSFLSSGNYDILIITENDRLLIPIYYQHQ